MFDMVYDGYSNSNNRKGNHLKIKGNNLTVMGNHNEVIGDNNTVIGNHNTVIGHRAIVSGNHNKIYGGDVIRGNYGKIKKLKGKPLKKYNKFINKNAPSSKKSKNKQQVKDWGLRDELNIDELKELNNYMKKFEE